MATIKLIDPNTSGIEHTHDVIDARELDEATWYDQSPTYAHLVDTREATEGQGDVHCEDAYLEEFLAQHQARGERQATENNQEYLVIFDAHQESLGAIELQVDGCVQWLEVLVALNY